MGTDVYGRLHGVTVYLETNQVNSCDVMMNQNSKKVTNINVDQLRLFSFDTYRSNSHLPWPESR